MRVLTFALAVSLSATLSLKRDGSQDIVTASSERPESTVSRLYDEVVAYHPIGIPEGRDRKVFDRFLSKALLQKLQLAEACSDDWRKQNQGAVLKAPFNWLESGLFSGDDEKASPSSFQIERTQLETDGLFRVYVRLTLKEPPPETWRVVAIIVRQNGHFLLDDVIYLTDQGRPEELRLSKYLSYGCDGRHWVGYGKNRKNAK